MSGFMTTNIRSSQARLKSASRPPCQRPVARYALHDCLERAGTGHPVWGAESCKIKFGVPRRSKSGLSPD